MGAMRGRVLAFAMSAVLIRPELAFGRSAPTSEKEAVGSLVGMLTISLTIGTSRALGFGPVLQFQVYAPTDGIDRLVQIVCIDQCRAGRECFTGRA